MMYDLIPNNQKKKHKHKWGRRGFVLSERQKVENMQLSDSLNGDDISWRLWPSI
jgi:hypothetical protein